MKYEYKLWAPTDEMTSDEIESIFNDYGESGWAFISRDAVGRNVFMKVKSATSTATTVVEATPVVRRGRPRGLDRPRPK